MESPPPPNGCFLFFVLLCSFVGFSGMDTSNTFTIDTCVKDLSDLINEIGEHAPHQECSRLIIYDSNKAAVESFHVPPAKIREKPVFCIQKLISQQTK